MKKLFFIFSSVVGLIIIYFNIGFPWDYGAAKKAFKNHLDQYEKEIVLENISFDFLHGQTYHGLAHVSDEPELRFYIGQLRNGEIEDGYEYETFIRDATEDIQKLINKYIPGATANVEVVSLELRELEINVRTSEFVSDQLRNKILNAIQNEGYTTNQLFFNASG